MISEDILKVTTFLTQKIGERSQIKVYFFVRRPNSQLTACRYRDILRILYIRIEELSPRYKHSQIKAATHVNSEMLQFYWSLGKDIVTLHAESRWGEKFLVNLSSDLRVKLPGVKGLSETSIEYAKRFYLLYNKYFTIHPQLGGELQDSAISEYELSKLYPADFKGTLPSIEEIENELK